MITTLSIAGAQVTVITLVVVTLINDYVINLQLLNEPKIIVTIRHQTLGGGPRIQL